MKDLHCRDQYTIYQNLRDLRMYRDIVKCKINGIKLVEFGSIRKITQINFRLNTIFIRKLSFLTHI